MNAFAKTVLTRSAKELSANMVAVRSRQPDNDALQRHERLRDAAAPRLRDAAAPRIRDAAAPRLRGPVVLALNLVRSSATYPNRYRSHLRD
jgi:hypothetical protein